jgi:hypothetical protein
MEAKWRRIHDIFDGEEVGIFMTRWIARKLRVYVVTIFCCEFRVVREGGMTFVHDLIEAIANRCDEC